MRMHFAPDAIMRYFQERLEKFQRSGSNQASARCPFHDDRKPSLSLNLETGLWNCHGCGKHGDLVGFEAAIEGCDRDQAKGSLKQSIGTLLSASQDGQPGRIVATYPYTDENGSLLYE